MWIQIYLRNLAQRIVCKDLSWGSGKWDNIELFSKVVAFIETSKFINFSFGLDKGYVVSRHKSHAHIITMCNILIYDIES